MKAAICYEIVARTLNIILKIPQKLWNVRQCSFEFNFSPRMRTTLIYIYIGLVYKNVALKTPMMISVIANCPDLASPQYFGQVYASG